MNKQDKQEAAYQILNRIQHTAEPIGEMLAEACVVGDRVLIEKVTKIQEVTQDVQQYLEGKFEFKEMVQALVKP